MEVLKKEEPTVEASAAAVESKAAAPVEAVPAEDANPALKSSASASAVPAAVGAEDGLHLRAAGKTAAKAAAAASTAAAAAAAAEVPPPAPSPKALKKPAGRTWLGFFFTVAAIGSVLGFLAVCAWLYKPMSKAWNNTRSVDHPSEDVYDLGLGDGSTARFPSTVRDKPTLYLSVIVPAYNEEKRIPEERGIDDMIADLTARQAQQANFTWEIIVVDDGSKDGTAALVLSQYVTKHGADKVRLLKSAANGGKGAAVRKGMMRARGKWLLMADADGATQFSALDDLLAAAKGVATAGRAPRAFALGSRAHLKKARSPLRQLLSRGFHAVISLLLGGQSIQDTQCGFKLLTRAAARQLFGALHIERWAFDVELVYLAGLFGVPAVEVPVAWHEVGGSKLDPTSASIEMLRDIIVIRLAYLAGLWKVAV